MHCSLLLSRIVSFLELLLVVSQTIFHNYCFLHCLLNYVEVYLHTLLVAVEWIAF